MCTIFTLLPFPLFVPQLINLMLSQSLHTKLPNPYLLEYLIRLPYCIQTLNSELLYSICDGTIVLKTILTTRSVSAANHLHPSLSLCRRVSKWKINTGWEICATASTAGLTFRPSLSRRIFPPAIAPPTPTTCSSSGSRIPVASHLQLMAAQLLSASMEV